MLEFLATTTTQLGSYGWTFFSLQVIGLVAGIYLLVSVQSTHPVRGPLLQRFSIALTALTGLGVFLAIARFANFGPLAMRWWFYVLFIVELLFVAYTIYYYRTIYPQQMAAHRASSRGSRGRTMSSSQAASNTRNGTTTPSAPNTPRPEPTTNRRASRRGRKRRDR